MLSKSAAKAFFLGGTAMCSTVFLGLTWDTFQQMPARTNAAGLTDSVKRGKHLWEDKNCMGCHTVFGEGAYYAPEPTRVHERRGPRSGTGAHLRFTSKHHLWIPKRFPGGAGGGVPAFRYPTHGAIGAGSGGLGLGDGERRG